MNATLMKKRDDDSPTGEIVGVRTECLQCDFNAGGCRRINDPQYTGVTMFERDGQSGEVVITRYHDALFSKGARQNRLVARIASPVACPHDIVTCCPDSLGEPTREAVIDQQFHRREE